MGRQEEEETLALEEGINEIRGKGPEHLQIELLPIGCGTSTIGSSDKDEEGEQTPNYTNRSDLMKSRIEQMKKAIDSYREYKTDLSFSLHSQYSMDEEQQADLMQSATP